MHCFPSQQRECQFMYAKTSFNKSFHENKYAQLNAEAAEEALAACGGEDALPPNCRCSLLSLNIAFQKLRDCFDEFPPS